MIPHPIPVRESPAALTAIRGVRAAGVACGIKRKGLDLALIVADASCPMALVTTVNAFKAAPLLLSERHAVRGRFRAVVVNSGNANACTGPRGMRDAAAMVAAVARKLRCPVEEVYVASTGVISAPLPLPRILRGISAAVGSLSRTGGKDAARAILTTDTFPKGAVCRIRLEDRTVTVGGIAKGSGMIAPRMATMLSFVATDAAVTASALRQALVRAVDLSFNRILVDGDMSTNDMVLLFATGAAGGAPLTLRSPDFPRFQEALTAVTAHLARAIVRDGEGATKCVEIRIRGARTRAEAERGARAVALSPLVKTAFAGEDCNWGRIMAALGASGISLSPEKITLDVGAVPVVRRGVGLGKAAERRAQRVMRKGEFSVTVDLHRGSGEAVIWTCDLTERYVRINTSYRS